ncbi:MAG: MazG family protein [Clostridia bacterium]|nr:MazG family protein [Clostridia bacterium]
MDGKIKELSKKERYTFDDLKDIMAILRSEGGCPWDREQTHLSIRENLIEEAYEAIEGIDNGDKELLKEELGDVLFQIMFHSRIEEEQGCFDVDDVIDGVSRKMVHRHPHIFADRKLDTTSQVLDAWDKIKTEEKSRVRLTDKLRSIPRQFPALVRAQKVAEKGIKADVVTLTAEEALSIVSSRVAALQAGDGSPDGEKALGEILFALSVYAARMDLRGERALTYEVDSLIDAIEAQG